MRYLTFIFILCSSISFAQFGKEMPELNSQTFNPVTYEAIPYWNSDTSFIDLVILYRVNPSFLFFAKTGSLQQDTYEAKGELIVEIIDKNNITVARDSKSILIEQNSSSPENTLSSREVQGAFVFKLKKGLYTLAVEAKDDESNKSFLNRDMKVDAQIFSASGLNISPVIFIEPTHPDSASSDHSTFFPVNYGGNVLIGQPGACLFQAISPDTNADIHLAWKIHRKNENDNENLLELEGERCFRQNGTLAVIENGKHISFTIKKGPVYSRFIAVPIPVERLSTATYAGTLTITQDTLKTVKRFQFKVIWPLKPRSLSDPKIAVEALKLIATEDEIDQMSSFSSTKSRKAFQAFWHKRNPDTTRAYNSVMAEYYRRVDESIKRFSIGNEKDGYQTDRGRIYILFGSPTVTNRLLKPNTVPAEVWTYENLKKRFTFRDTKKNGSYILVKTETY